MISLPGGASAWPPYWLTALWLQNLPALPVYQPSRHWKYPSATTKVRLLPMKLSYAHTAAPGLTKNSQAYHLWRAPMVFEPSPALCQSESLALANDHCELRLHGHHSMPCQKTAA